MFWSGSLYVHVVGIESSDFFSRFYHMLILVICQLNYYYKSEKIVYRDRVCLCVYNQS